MKEFSEGYCKVEKKKSSNSLHVGTLLLEALTKVTLAYNHVIEDNVLTDKTKNYINYYKFNYKL